MNSGTGMVIFGGVSLAGIGAMGSVTVEAAKWVLYAGRKFEKKATEFDEASWKHTACKVMRGIALLAALALDVTGMSGIVIGSAGLVTVSTCMPVFILITIPIVALGAYEFMGGIFVASEVLKDLVQPIFQRIKAGGWFTDFRFSPAGSI